MVVTETEKASRIEKPLLFAPMRSGRAPISRWALLFLATQFASPIHPCTALRQDWIGQECPRTAAAHARWCIAPDECPSGGTSNIGVRCES